MTQQTSTHMKPANQTIHTKTFSKLLQFKGSNDNAVEFKGILQLWHSSAILVKFDLGPIFTFLPLPLWKMTWEASLPNPLPLGPCPFTHKWGSHNGHQLLFIKRGMAPWYRPFLELGELSPFLMWLKFTLLLHVLSDQGPRPGLS